MTGTLARTTRLRMSISISPIVMAGWTADFSPYARRVIASARQQFLERDRHRHDVVDALREGRELGLEVAPARDGQDRSMTTRGGRQSVIRVASAGSRGTTWA